MLYLSVNVTSKFKCMNVNIWISRLKISRYFQELSQLYLELVDACKKRFMTQIRRVAVLKRSPVWKKMRKSFKTLSELKLKFIPKTWKQEAMAQKTPPKTTPPPTWRLIIENRYSNSTFNNLVWLLKNMDGECVSLGFFFNFKKEK